LLELLQNKRSLVSLASDVRPVMLSIYQLSSNTGLP